MKSLYYDWWISIHFIIAFLFCHCGCGDLVFNSHIKTNSAIFTKFFRKVTAMKREKTFACVKVASRQ